MKKFIAMAIVAIFMAMTFATMTPTARANESSDNYVDVPVYDFYPDGTIVTTIQHWKESEIQTAINARALEIATSSNLNVAAEVQWSGVAPVPPTGSLGAFGIYPILGVTLTSGGFWAHPLLGDPKYEEAPLMFTLKGFRGSYSCWWNGKTYDTLGSGFAAAYSTAGYSDVRNVLELIDASAMG